MAEKKVALKVVRMVATKGEKKVAYWAGKKA